MFAFLIDICLSNYISEVATNLSFKTNKDGINFQIKIRKTAKGFILILTMKIVLTYLKRHLSISVNHPKNDSRSSSFDGVVSKILFSREIWEITLKIIFLVKAHDTYSSCFIFWTVVGIFTSATSVYFKYVIIQNPI